jgi:hypothetical protein
MASCLLDVGTHAVAAEVAPVLGVCCTDFVTVMATPPLGAKYKYLPTLSSSASQAAAIPSQAVQLGM